MNKLLYVAYVPLQVLITTPEFQALTAAQAGFVSKYVSRGVTKGVYDAVTAVQSAYHCKDRKTAAIQAYQLLRNRRIAKVIDLHFLRDAERVNDLQRLVHRSSLRHEIES